MNGFITIDRDDDPERRMRRQWGRSLTEHLKLAGLSRKQFQQQLATYGVEVTHQAIAQWLAGRTAPKPSHQAAIAAVLRVPARSLFPLEVAA